MDALWSALAATDIAGYMRTARWGYAAVNGLHVLGIALLVGAILPLDLRLLGAWPSVPLATLSRVLRPVAAAGLVLAVTCGVLLFLASPADYAALPVFQAKMGLVVLGTASALWISATGGLAQASRPVLRAAALVSLASWLGALALGRLIAFVIS